MHTPISVKCQRAYNHPHTAPDPCARRFLFFFTRPLTSKYLRYTFLIIIYIIYISQFHSRISFTFLNSTQVYHLHFSIPLIYIMYISQFQYIYITHNHLYHLNFSIPRKICTHTYAWTGTHTNLGFLEHPNGGRNGLAIVVGALAPAAQDQKQMTEIHILKSQCVYM